MDEAKLKERAERLNPPFTPTRPPWPGELAGQRDEAEAPRGISTSQLENWFTYHRPSPEQSFAYMDIRQAGLLLASTILRSTPPGPDQSAAIRKVREAVMTANAAIACNGQ